MSEKIIDVYTDGSYTWANPDTTFGAFYIPSMDVKMVYKMSTPQARESRNVAGELIGSMMAILEMAKLADESPEKIVMNLIYDYEGVGKWLTGEWRAKKTLTQKYVQFVSTVLNSTPNLKLTLTWVRGHKGLEGNVIADGLARGGASNPQCIDITEQMGKMLH